MANYSDLTTYPGGKARLYQWLINRIPPHSVFVSTHLGNCAVMRYKRPAKLNIGIDLDPAVIEMWQARACTAGDIDGAGGAAATPEPTSVATIDKLGEASWHYREHRCAPAHIATSNDDPGAIATPSEATRYNFINADCVPWLKSYQFTGSEFVYADPPYLMHTRKQQAAIYRHEYTVAQHIELLHTLVDLPCPVMVSGYDSQIYNHILDGWRKETIQTVTRGASLATEVIWMNYPEPEALHDYRYLGDGYRERERIKRKKRRWRERWRAMDRLERQAILAAIQEAAQC